MSIPRRLGSSFLVAPLIWACLSYFASAQSTEGDFRIDKVHFINISMHTGDGRINIVPGIRAAIYSFWLNTGDNMVEFTNYIINNPRKYIENRDIIEFMIEGDKVEFVFEFYKPSQFTGRTEFLYRIIYFKDNSRRGWERLRQAPEE